MHKGNILIQKLNDELIQIKKAAEAAFL